MWVLWTIIAVLTCLLGISIYLNVRLGKVVLKVQDTVEDALDVLDEKYASMSKILDIPLFYDSTEVRGVVEDIKATRESILDVARALTKIDESDFELEENQPKTGDIIGKEG
jgi:nitrate reductase NapAB chaperone NapD|tara:strand:- start:95 stop:430 length:336 start_codon:yes stop_codon:yes gene_type:complete